MAKAYMCDQCKKLIAEDDVRITLCGYEVAQKIIHKNIVKKPRGYAIRQPQDFCSFTCLAEWANEEQKMLEDYLMLAEKYGGADNE